MSRLCDVLDPYDRIVRKTLDEFILFKTDWEITFRCNLRCYHCYQTGAPFDKELTTEEAYSVIDQLADLGCLYITFTGGEILLRQDFFDIARYARRKGFAIRLFTNGTLIDEEIADRIKELNPLSVEISLYGMAPLVHENITKTEGSYEKTINAFKLLKTRNINTVVKCTFMRENVSEFDKLKCFAQDMGSRFVFSLTVIPKIDGSKEVLKFRLTEEQLKELFRSRDWLVEGIAKGGVHSYKPMCSAGINSLYISPYGEVFPCVVLREYCWSLRELPLKEIWESPFLKKIRELKFEDLKECSSCDLSYYCNRCAGLALLEGEDLFGPSISNCTLAGVRKWAMKRREINHERREEEKILQEAKDSL